MDATHTGVRPPKTGVRHLVQAVGVWVPSIIAWSLFEAEVVPGVDSIADGGVPALRRLVIYNVISWWIVGFLGFVGVGAACIPLRSAPRILKMGALCLAVVGMLVGLLATAFNLGWYLGLVRRLPA
jgi:hypothetical protein